MSKVTTSIVFVISFLMMTFSMPGYGLDEERLVIDSRMATKALGTTLKSRLKIALKKGGTMYALTVCKVEAMPLTHRVSGEVGMMVGRTALRYRNPDNAPDDWEKRVLKEFAARKAVGEKVNRLEHYEIVNESGVRRLRYMKAIAVGKVCLACHGERLAPDVADFLDRSYPFDRARGFKVGEIRGAFTVSKILGE